MPPKSQFRTLAFYEPASAGSCYRSPAVPRPSGHSRPNADDDKQPLTVRNPERLCRSKQSWLDLQTQHNRSTHSPVRNSFAIQRPPTLHLKQAYRMLPPVPPPTLQSTTRKMMVAIDIKVRGHFFHQRCAASCPAFHRVLRPIFSPTSPALPLPHSNPRTFSRFPTTPMTSSYYRFYATFAAGSRHARNLPQSRRRYFLT